MSISAVAAVVEEVELSLVVIGLAVVVVLWVTVVVSVSCCVGTVVWWCGGEVLVLRCVVLVLCCVVFVVTVVLCGDCCVQLDPTRPDPTRMPTMTEAFGGRTNNDHRMPCIYACYLSIHSSRSQECQVDAE